MESTHTYTPIVLMHGLFAQHAIETDKFITKYMGNEVYVKNIFMGTAFTAIHEAQQQAELLAQELMNDPNLKNGFNLIAHSQGGLLCRYFIERYNTPPVFNFITLASPHNGVGGIASDIDEEHLWMKDLNPMSYTWLYSAFAQKNIALSNYWKDTVNYDEYLKGCVFLPYLNNEKPHENSLLFKDNIEKLHNFVLIKALHDEIVEPIESQQFGYYKKGSNSELETFFESEQYTKNLLGLRTLYDEGRLHFRFANTMHREICTDETNFVENILPFLKLDDTTRESSLIAPTVDAQAQAEEKKQQIASSKPLLFVGNWKMNMPLNDSISFYKNNRNALVTLSNATNATIVLCPEFPILRAMVGFFDNCGIEVGAQDCSSFEKGAYTGQVSALTVAQTGAKYCLVGHSERRQLLHESNQDVAQKAILLIANNVIPIVCVGETKEQNEKNETIATLKQQLDPVLTAIKAAQPAAKLCIAYEPVWAIGSQKTPDSATLNTVFNEIAAYCTQQLPQAKILFLYGGSVDASNAPLFKLVSNINGFLVGGASTDFEKFRNLVTLCYDNLDLVQKITTS